MRAGKLRDRIEIQRPVREPDALGDSKVRWETVAFVDGSDLPQAGREVWRAKMADPQISGVVSIRYFEGLDALCRLRIGGRELNIVGVHNPDGRRREHLIAYAETPQKR